MNQSLTIVIPIHNEQNRLPDAIRKLGEYRALGYRFEVIFIENGSSDATYSTALQFCRLHSWARLLQTHTRGKGLALKVGVLAAETELIYTADVDFSTPLIELCKFIDALPGCNLVIGSREIIRRYTQTTLKRRVIGRVFHALLGGLVPGIQDTQCGFKLYRRQAAQRLFGLLRTGGLAYDVEILYLAHRLGYGVKEIPVLWKHDPDSRVNLVADSWQMFWDVLKIPLTHSDKQYKKLPA